MLQLHSRICRKSCDCESLLHWNASPLSSLGAAFCNAKEFSFPHMGLAGIAACCRELVSAQDRSSCSLTYIQ